MQALTAQGWRVDHRLKSLSESELIETLPAYHALGIRSKTKITASVLAAAPKVYFKSSPSMKRH